jgi:hypothetical protein
MMLNNCNWESIDGFESPGEFQRFCTWLDAQVQSGAVVDLAINKKSPSMPFGFEEKWFRCKASGETWRRVTPEFPFRGLWEEIS